MSTSPGGARVAGHVVIASRDAEGGGLDRRQGGRASRSAPHLEHHRLGQAQCARWRMAAREAHLLDRRRPQVIDQSPDLVDGFRFTSERASLREWRAALVSVRVSAALSFSTTADPATVRSRRGGLCADVDAPHSPSRRRSALESRAGRRGADRRRRPLPRTSRSRSRARVPWRRTGLLAATRPPTSRSPRRVARVGSSGCRHPPRSGVDPGPVDRAPASAMVAEIDAVKVS